MCSPRQSAEPDSLQDWVLQKQNASCKGYEFVRRNDMAQQRHRNSLYSKRGPAPT